MTSRKNKTGIIQERETKSAKQSRRLSAESKQRLKAQSAFAESEEVCRNFMEEAPIGICIADLSGHVQYVNKKIEEVTGWQREELLSRNGLKAGFFDEETKLLLIKRLAARLQGDEARTTVVPVNCRDGSRRWVNVKTTILCKDGQPSGLQLAFIDMTEQKQMEEALRENENKYRLLADAMTDIVWIQDMNLHTVYVSPSIQTQLGFTPEERLLQDVRDQLTPESLSLALNTLAREIALERQGQADPHRKVMIELEYYHKDGSTRWFENIIGGIRDEQGVLTELHGVSRNVTRRHQALEALRESEKKYRELVDFLPISLYEIDPRGNLISGNPEIFKTFGYAAEDFEKGVNIYQMLVTPQDRARALETGRMILSGFQTEEAEYTGLRKDGSTFPFLNIAGPMIREGRPVGLRGAIIDLTGQKQAEKDLEDVRSKLLQSEKLASIGRIAAGVAHEILNPLNIISLELQFLQAMENLPPVISEEIEICMTQVGRIVAIAENLKQFSRIPANRMAMADINEVISDVLRLYATQLHINGIAVETQYQKDLPKIFMDKEKIEQVLVNLISNAEAAMAEKEKKVLRITTRGNELAGDTASVTIVIADTGAGIRKENLRKIFEPFFTTRRQNQGTGLGLSISYGIIQGHGGNIWAENNEWGGASLIIEFPVKTAGKMTGEVVR